MSFRAMEWARKVRGVSMQHRLVLIYLAHRHNADTGRCDASQARMAAELECSERHVRRMVAGLQQAGLLRIHTRHNRSHRATNQYELFVADLPEIEWKPSPKAERSMESDDAVQFGEGSTGQPCPVATGQPCPPNCKVRITRRSNHTSPPSGGRETAWDEIVSGVMFAAWWEAYPRRRRAAKAKCWARWSRMPFEDRVGAWREVVERRRGDRDEEWMRGYSPAPLVYLNQERWQQAWEAEHGDEAFERDHGGPRVRKDGGDLVTRAIEANRRWIKRGGG